MANQADVVDELIGAAVVEVGRGAAVAHAEKAIDVDDREALLVFAQWPAAGAADIQAVDAQGLDSEIGTGARAEFGNVSLIQPKRASFSSEGVKVWTYCAARLVLGNVEL